MRRHARIVKAGQPSKAGRQRGAVVQKPLQRSRQSMVLLEQLFMLPLQGLERCGACSVADVQFG